MPMVELLFRVVDKDPNDHAASMCGDVIAVCPSPMAWGLEELHNPAWRIVRANLPDSLLQALLFSQQRLIRKEWRINIASLPQKQKFHGPRQDQIIDVDADSIVGATERKPL